MSKIRQTKIPMQMENLFELIAQGDPNWKLVRERDGLIKHSVDVMWLEWNEEGRFKAKHAEPAVGRSLLMSPFNEFFTWQTTSVTEITEQREDYIKFRTGNSTYELFKLTNNEQDTNS
jgi:hypothetical protein